MGYSIQVAFVSGAADPLTLKVGQPTDAPLVCGTSALAWALAL